MTRIPEDHEPDYKECGLPDAKDMGWIATRIQKMEIADGHDAAKNQISGSLLSMKTTDGFVIRPKSGVSGSSLSMQMPEGGIVVPTPEGDTRVTDESLDNIAKDRNAALEQYTTHILYTLLNPDEVWRVCHTGQAGQEHRKKYLKVLGVDETKIGFVASVREEPDERNTLLTVSKCERWEDIDRQRRGELVYSTSWEGMPQASDPDTKYPIERAMERIAEGHEVDYREYGLPDAEDMGWIMRKVQKMKKADGHDAAQNYVSDFLMSYFVRSMPPMIEDIEVTDKSLDNIVKDRNAALEQYIFHILLTLYDPDEVWRVCHTGQAGQKEYRKKYLKVFADDEAVTGFVASAREESDEKNILLTVSKCGQWKDIDSQRQGEMVYSRGGFLNTDKLQAYLEKEMRGALETPVGHIWIPHKALEDIVEDRDEAMERYANHINLTLCEPDEVWLVLDAGGEEHKRKYVKSFSVSDPETGEDFSLGLVATAREAPYGDVLLTVAKYEQVEDLNEHRQSILLYAAYMQ